MEYSPAGFLSVETEISSHKSNYKTNHLLNLGQPQYSPESLFLRYCQSHRLRSDWKNLARMLAVELSSLVVTVA
jgi:hypothetical protein